MPRKSAPPLVLDQHTDGPPSIQREVITTTDGVVLRELTVERVEWDDPADKTGRTKRGARFGARKVRGFRRVWTIDVLHRGSPNEVTKAHVAAAERLVNDHQVREGAVLSSGSGSGVLGVVDVRVQAALRYEAAMAAVGEQGRFVLFRAAALNWTVLALAEALGITRDRAHGRLQAALDLLREHYDAGKKRAAHTPPRAPSEPIPIEVTDLPAERSGRWTRPQSRDGSRPAKI